MKKSEILAKLESSREQFLDALEGLSEEEMTTAGACGDWSVKDLLAHLSRWEAELVKLLWELRQSGRSSSELVKPGLDIDKLNAGWHAEARDRALARVLDDFHAVRNQTILRVEAFGERDLSDPKRYPALRGSALEAYIAANTYDHEDEHAADLLRWRKERQP